MNYLKKLKNCLQAILSKEHNADSYENRPVKSGEPLARYIFDKRQIDDNNKAKQGAFSPHSQRRDLSVCRSENASYEELAHLGQKFVGDVTNRKLLAWAEFNSDIAVKHKLYLNPDGIPFKRHLNVEQWPSDSSVCLMIKLEMANSCSTTLVK